MPTPRRALIPVIKRRQQSFDHGAIPVSRDLNACALLYFQPAAYANSRMGGSANGYRVINVPEANAKSKPEEWNACSKNGGI
jgi:hypothetical protein